MSKRIIPPVAKDLMASKEKIKDPKNWWNGQAGNGDCALTALIGAKESLPYLVKASVTLFDTVPATVNDRIGHAAVMLMYDHAISLAIEEANK
jgi:hypothetical protein